MILKGIEADMEENNLRRTICMENADIAKQKVTTNPISNHEPYH